MHSVVELKIFKNTRYRYEGLHIPLGLHDVQFPRISELSATHEDYKVVKPAHWPPLTPHTKYPWYSFVSGWFDPRINSAAGMIMILNKSQCTEPSTFRLVAHCLTPLHHRVPHKGEALDEKRKYINFHMIQR